MTVLSLSCHRQNACCIRVFTVSVTVVTVYFHSPTIRTPLPLFWTSFEHLLNNHPFLKALDFKGLSTCFGQLDIVLRGSAFHAVFPRFPYPSQSFRQLIHHQNLTHADFRQLAIVQHEMMSRGRCDNVYCMFGRYRYCRHPA